MDAVLRTPQPFNRPPTAPQPRTLDDLRIVHGNYDTAGSFSARSMRPVLLAALAVAAIAGIAIGVNSYSTHTVAKINTSAPGTGPDTPSASSVPAASSVPMPAAAATATDNPATDPLKPMTRSEEANSMPLAGQGNNHSSESMNPVKAKASVAAISARVTARSSAPVAVAPANQVAPIPAEIVAPLPPLSAPAPAPVEIPPVVPAPAPVVSPMVPAPAPMVPPAEPARL
jgi:hypothetical protein